MSSIQHDIDTPSFSEDESDSLSSDGSAAEDAFPSFSKITENLHFVWGDVDGNSFTSLLDQVYNEIVHWRRNIFSLPTGRSGKTNV